MALTLQTRQPLASGRASARAPKRAALAPVAFCRPTITIARCSPGDGFPKDARFRCGPRGSGGVFFGPGFSSFSSRQGYDPSAWAASPRARQWVKLFTEMSKDIANVVEQVVNEVEGDEPAQQRSAAPAASKETSQDGSIRLQLDVTEDEQAYFIATDVPGISKEDIKLQISAPDPTSGCCTLTITAERRRPTPSGESPAAASSDVCRTERPVGRYSRSLQLPNDAVRESVTAQTIGGVLNITVLRQPKIEPEQPPAMDIPVF